MPARSVDICIVGAGMSEQGVPITWPWSAKRFHKDMRKPDWSEFELRG